MGSLLKLRVLSEVFSSALHELSQPLTMMNFAAETLSLLAEKPPTSIANELSELSTQIQQGALRQKAILELLSDLVKGNTLERRINLHEFLESALRLFRSQLGALRIHTQTRLTAAQPFLRVPSGPLSLFIFLILCDAITHAERVDRRRRPKLSIKTRQRRNCLELKCQYTTVHLATTKELEAREKGFLNLLRSLAQALHASVTVSRQASRSLTLVEANFSQLNKQA
ncbi:MAG: hypothetical protein RML35_02095 [Chloroherpetonaceae bacterium]|nr:hypothetical protein [Chloroherpetonaceae bacterium]